MTDKGESKRLTDAEEQELDDFSKDMQDKISEHSKMTDEHYENMYKKFDALEESIDSVSETLADMNKNLEGLETKLDVMIDETLEESKVARDIKKADTVLAILLVVGVMIWLLFL